MAAASLTGIVGGPSTATWRGWEVSLWSGLILLITNFSYFLFLVHEGTCRLTGWAITAVVAAVVFLLLFLLCFCFCLGPVRRRRRAIVESSDSDLVMF